MSSQQKQITKQEFKHRRFFVSVTCTDDSENELECTNVTDDTETLKQLLGEFRKKSYADCIRVFDSKNGFAWIAALDDISWDHFCKQIYKDLDDRFTEPDTLYL